MLVVNHAVVVQRSDAVEPGSVVLTALARAPHTFRLHALPGGWARKLHSASSATTTTSSGGNNFATNSAGSTLGMNASHQFLPIPQMSNAGSGFQTPSHPMMSGKSANAPSPAINNNNNNNLLELERLLASRAILTTADNGNRIIAIFPEGKIKIVDVGGSFSAPPHGRGGFSSSLTMAESSKEETVSSFECPANGSAVCVIPFGTSEALLLLGTDEGTSSKVHALRLGFDPESCSIQNLSLSWSVPGGVSSLSMLTIGNNMRIVVSHSSCGGVTILDPLDWAPPQPTASIAVNSTPAGAGVNNVANNNNGTQGSVASDGAQPPGRSAPIAIASASSTAATFKKNLVHEDAQPSSLLPAATTTTNPPVQVQATRQQSSVRPPALRKPWQLLEDDGRPLWCTSVGGRVGEDEACFATLAAGGDPFVALYRLTLRSQQPPPSSQQQQMSGGSATPTIAVETLWRVSLACLGGPAVGMRYEPRLEALFVCSWGGRIASLDLRTRHVALFRTLIPFSPSLGGGGGAAPSPSSLATMPSSSSGATPLAPSIRAFEVGYVEADHHQEPSAPEFAVVLEDVSGEVACLPLSRCALLGRHVRVGPNGVEEGVVRMDPWERAPLPGRTPKGDTPGKNRSGLASRMSGGAAAAGRRAGGGGGGGGGEWEEGSDSDELSVGSEGGEEDPAVLALSSVPALSHPPRPPFPTQDSNEAAQLFVLRALKRSWCARHELEEGSLM